MSWRDEAACLGEPTWWWFPEPGAPPDARALYLCNTVCPVRDACEAASGDERHGWWAGIDRHKRRRGGLTAVPAPVQPVVHVDTRRWVSEQLHLAL